HPIFVWLSFQDYGLRELNRGTTNFVGLDNYTEIFSSSYLYTVVLPNTIGFALACVSLTLVLGTLIALFLRTLPKFWRYLTSTAVMIAWAVPAITGTYVWAFIFEPANGLATNLFSSLGLIDAGSTDWFLVRFYFYVVAPHSVMHRAPQFLAKTVLVGLLTVPVDLYGAARIDGAGLWRKLCGHPI